MSSGLKARSDLLTTLLREVSRSFYLTLRWLPGAVRPQISLAYLLARTTDTIADTELVAAEERIAALEAFRDRILGHDSGPVHFAALGRHHSSSAERHLLERADEAVGLLATFAAEDQAFIRDVLRTIISGQTLDLQRFEGASRHNVIALQRDAELEDYTYRVAGCVGEFWTRICRRHLFPAAPLDEPRLLAEAVHFGKGLQLVNILRDVPSDLTQGRCYLPADALDQLSLTPAALLDPANGARLRPLQERLVARAEDYLRDGWNYTNALPRGCVRLRLACAWPILIGVRTLVRLRHQNLLDPTRRIKVSREEVRDILVRSVLTYPWQNTWQKLYADAIASR